MTKNIYITQFAMSGATPVAGAYASLHLAKMRVQKHAEDLLEKANPLSLKPEGRKYVAFIRYDYDAELKLFSAFAVIDRTVTEPQLIAYINTQELCTE